MNPVSQFDHHPDADSLNAFVEHVLGAQEQAQVLAHIAACSRCREVVYLAQESASASEAHAPAAVATGTEAERHNPWFGGWRLAWVSAAAFTGLIALVVVLHFLRTEPAANLAQAVPQSEGAAVRPASPAPPVAAPQPVPSVHAAHPAAKALPAPLPERAKALTPPAAPLRAFSAEASADALSQADQNAAVLPAPAPAKVRSSQARYGPSQPAPSQQQQGAAGGALVSMKPSPTSAPATLQAAPAVEQAAPAAPPPAPVAGLAPGSGMAAARPMRAAPAQSRQFESAPSVPMAELSAASNTIVVQLPSGLPVLSTAEAQHKLLAIDAAGTLYLSEDSGKNWEQVARQWTGQPMNVHIREALNSVSETASASREGNLKRDRRGKAAAPPFPYIFELVNDSHQTWISSDGRTWKAK